VSKDALREAFSRAGGGNVRTVIQSGNVLFDAAPDRMHAIVASARRRLRPVLGETVVIVRSAAELARLLRRGPFAGTTAPPSIKRYIVFLPTAPARRPTLPLASHPEELDLVAVSKQDCWIVSRRKPSGMYGFPGLFVEAALGVAGTARNWSTVTKLAALATSRPSGSATAPTAPASRSSPRSRTNSRARA
jgi:uncharacterized protein (DUF1697 family)